ncbi:peptidoglycan-associated lipoprotein [Roseivivax halodurans JCM 10272]|uniref:Peptidoglycan-associated lipoprotein n=1 Tax=Roseivivax halodurans JCM 10272 TaxID=1449350 RepID=X7EJU0_9RHOB|nr:OmpA family protein [Roseivivax halodurans]ETX15383.1 peptidoglycan-associated lipoprotein [Roseivivax halodurans JCM 10272]
MDMRRHMRAAAIAALGFGVLGGAAAAQESAAPACGVTIFFNAGQTVIGRQARDVLIEYARDYPGAPMVITGYSDAAGSAAANQAVSLQRARSVAAALEGTAILTVSGAGAAVLPGTSGQNDPANRRVDAVRQDCG